MKLKQLLATIMVIGSFALIPNVTWAEAEAETEVVNDAPPDELLPKDTEKPKYSGLPTIKFINSKLGVLIVQINGISADDIDGFMIDNLDISKMMEDGQKGETDPKDKVELIKFTEFDEKDGFQVQINFQVQQLLDILKPGPHNFCVKYSNGAYSLCGIVDFEKLLKAAEESDDSKGFGWTRVTGKVYKRGRRCFIWCWNVWKPASGSVVYFYMYKNGWKYKGATRTNGSGYYKRYLQGNDASYLRIYAECPNGGRRLNRTVRGPGCRNCPARINRNFYCK